MHKHFSDWYREVDIEPTDAILRKRNAGVKKLVASISADHIFEIVRILFANKLRNEEWKDDFCENFRTTDPSFPMRNNEKELVILSGTAIAELISSKNDQSIIAALATICASFIPYDQIPPRSDIISEANIYLLSESAKLRAKIEAASFKTPKLGVKTLPEKLKEIKTDIESGATPPNDANSTVTIIESISKVCEAINKLTETIGSQYNSLKVASDMISEESNILWWLFGGYSRDLGKKMCDLNPETTCLIAGKELADLVKVLPGPFSVQAILDSMVGTGRSEISESFQLKDIINISPNEWRANWLEGIDIDNLRTICPIHLAAQTSLLTDSRDKWGSVFNKQIKKGTSLKKSPLEFALQVYREALLLKMV